MEYADTKRFYDDSLEPKYSSDIFLQQVGKNDFAISIITNHYSSHMWIPRERLERLKDKINDLLK